MAYSKRPLSLDELCEAVATSDLDTGENLDDQCEIFSDKLLAKCEPFVRIEEIETAGRHRSFARLAHFSLKNFLVQNPNLFSPDAKLSITPEFMAMACLKYLQQARYSVLLVRAAKTFVTGAESDDINDHALLGYAAKYWYRHMDDLPYSPDICHKVEVFVTSSNYFTLLQFQSLFVDGMSLTPFTA